MKLERSAAVMQYQDQKVSVKDLSRALAAPLRWAILTELSDGKPDMVRNIAQKLHVSPVLISQHIGILRRMGIVVVGLGRLYSIAPQFLNVEQRQLDFGVCVLRLKKAETQPA